MLANTYLSAMSSIRIADILDLVEDRFRDLLHHFFHSKENQFMATVTDLSNAIDALNSTASTLSAAVSDLSTRLANLPTVGATEAQLDTLKSALESVNSTLGGLAAIVANIAPATPTDK